MNKQNSCFQIYDRSFFQYSLILTGFPQMQRPPLRRWETGSLRVKRQQFIGFSESGWSCSKSPYCETICEKITNRKILPNQFSATLAVFSGPKRGVAEPPPPNFRLGGLPPPLPLPRHHLCDCKNCFNGKTVLLHEQC